MGSSSFVRHVPEIILSKKLCVVNLDHFFLYMNRSFKLHVARDHDAPSMYYRQKCKELAESAR